MIASTFLWRSAVLFKMFPHVSFDLLYQSWIPFLVFHMSGIICTSWSNPCLSERQKSGALRFLYSGTKVRRSFFQERVHPLLELVRLIKQCKHLDPAYDRRIHHVRSMVERKFGDTKRVGAFLQQFLAPGVYFRVKLAILYDLVDPSHPLGFRRTV